MKNTFKISTKYWESLTEKEQLFFKHYAGDIGVQRCKRIITLANRVFHNWDYILEASTLKINVIKDEYWVIIKNKKVVGMIFKRGKWESISILYKDRLTMAWHNNLGQRNPPATLITDYGTKYELLSIKTEESNYINIPPISVCV